MAVNVSAIDDEIAGVARSLQTSWTDFAIYCKAKIFECGINGAVASYTVNGRTVVKDLAWWEGALRLAQNQASIESSGGIDEIPISFRSRR